MNSLAERAILSVAVATLRRPQDDTPEPIATLRRLQDDTPTYGFFGLSNVVVDFVFCCITSSFTQ